MKFALPCCGPWLDHRHAMPEPLRWDMTLPNGEPLRWDMGPAFRWDGSVPENLNPSRPMQQNDIDISITAQQEAEILATLESLRTKLLAFAQDIPAAKLESYFRLGTSRLAFHQGCHTYMHQRPDTVPPTVDVPAYDRDQAAWDSLERMRAKLAGVERLLSATQTVVGADLLAADLSYYAYLPLAANAGVAGADEIHADLKKDYPGRGRTAAAKPTPSA